MKKNRTVLLFALSCFCAFVGNSQTEKTSGDLQKWGLEFNVVWPFVPGVEIYTAKATRTIWVNDKAHGDLTFGVLWRPGTTDDENAEKFSETGLNLGYRQYFWNGLHAELAVYPSIGKETRNKKDRKDYQGFALTTELYAGYKFSFNQDKSVSWYLMPQAGMGYNAISNLGPQTEENGLFPTLNLQVGINF